jgi:hypothetical protein
MPELILSVGVTIAWSALAGIEWLSRDKTQVSACEARDYRAFFLFGVCLIASYAVFWATWVFGR